MNKIQFLKSLIAADPYTYLLLHMDGENNGTSFPDSSRFARTMTRSGDTKTVTAQSQFGGASAYFDGTGDYLSNSDAGIALGSGDFTVDFWLRLPSSVVETIFDTQVIGGASSRTNSIRLSASSSRELIITHNGAIRITSSALSLNTWYHVAIVRSGSTTTLYVGGTSRGTTTAITANLSTASVVIGMNASSSSEFFAGYIDEFRLSPGIARWTTAFTPPTSAYLM